MHIWLDFDFSFHVLTGVGETTCPAGARHGHSEDHEVRGSKGSRHGEGTEAPQRGKHLSSVKKKRVFVVLLGVCVTKTIYAALSH